MTHIFEYVPPQVTFTLPRNIGQATGRRGTPECILAGPFDPREVYRMLASMNTYPTAKGIACLLGWRYARVDAALVLLEEKGWVGFKMVGGRKGWAVTP